LYVLTRVPIRQGKTKKLEKAPSALETAKQEGEEQDVKLITSIIVTKAVSFSSPTQEALDI
jgi:hypothetical protein